MDQILSAVITAPAIIPLVLICGVLSAVHLWMQSTPYMKLGNSLPGPKALPFVGNLTYMIRSCFCSPDEMMSYAIISTKRFLKDGVCRFWAGNKLLVLVKHPDDIEKILGSNVHLEKSEEYRVFEPWLGEGLLISKGDKWKTHRKIIAPTFHSSILKSFVPIFNENSRRCVKNLRAELGREFDVHDYMSGITVDILLETAMGVKRNETVDEDSGYDYAMAVMKMCGILHARHYRFVLYPDFIFRWTRMKVLQDKLLNVINSLTKQVINWKRDNYFQRVNAGETTIYNDLLTKSNNDIISSQNKFQGTESTYTYIRDDLDENDENDVGEKRRLAFLDFMIEASQMRDSKLTDNEINEEVNTIMFEGHDTTAAGSSFVLCLLGVHQDIQSRVMDELDDIFQDSDRQCMYNDTVRMKYLERVILEALRLYPPVPMIARKLNENVQLANGKHTVPRGATVVIGTFLVHRDPNIYPDPDVFDPDRFLPENCQKRHYYSFIPFSAGPRSCVGRKYAMLKLKILLSTILRNFKVTSPCKEKDFKLQGDIILKRSDGFRIKLEERRITVGNV